MFTVLRNTWALFFGFGIICLGHGLQGTLIGVRSVLEGFSFIATQLLSLLIQGTPILQICQGGELC